MTQTKCFFHHTVILKVTNFDYQNVIKARSVINYKKPTAQMLGRFQPFHEGHFELFKKTLENTGQVIIMVKLTDDGEDNPYTYGTVIIER